MLTWPVSPYSGERLLHVCRRWSMPISMFQQAGITARSIESTLLRMLQPDLTAQTGKELITTSLMFPHWLPICLSIHIYSLPEYISGLTQPASVCVRTTSIRKKLCSNFCFYAFGPNYSIINMCFYLFMVLTFMPRDLFIHG